MRRAIALLLLVSGCGPDGWDTPHFAWESPVLEVGMMRGPAEDGLTPEVVDVSGVHVLAGLADLGLPLWQITEATRSARVDVTPGPFECEGAYGQRLGYECLGQQFAFRLKVAKTDCVWNTAYMHELTHLLLDIATGDPNGQHTWKDAWKPAGDILGPCPTALAKMAPAQAYEGNP